MYLFFKDSLSPYIFSSSICTCFSKVEIILYCFSIFVHTSSVFFTTKLYLCLISSCLIINSSIYFCFSAICLPIFPIPKRIRSFLKIELCSLIYLISSSCSKVACSLLSNSVLTSFNFTFNCSFSMSNCFKSNLLFAKLSPSL